jgi:hypothetical protein
VQRPWGYSARQARPPGGFPERATRAGGGCDWCPPPGPAFRREPEKPGREREAGGLPPTPRQSAKPEARAGAVPGAGEGCQARPLRQLPARPSHRTRWCPLADAGRQPPFPPRLLPASPSAVSDVLWAGPPWAGGALGTPERVAGEIWRGSPVLLPGYQSDMHSVPSACQALILLPSVFPSSIWAGTYGKRTPSKCLPLSRALPPLHISSGLNLPP